VNLLLDTHIALWAITDSPKLSAQAHEYILAPDATIHVSAVSVWEIAIKHSLQRQTMPLSGQEALNYFQQAGYRLLTITPGHCITVETLPKHHADPFDRLLVAQALSEPMSLVTHDNTVATYNETIILV
jgi:PIN domain nuclease of toxin-antitoxin system